LDRVQAPFLAILQDDGCTSAQAKAKMNELFADASNFLRDSRSQGELEAKIKSSVGHHPGKMSSNDTFKLLPGFIGLSTFDFDIRKWVLAGVEPDGDWERTKPAMRYFQLWDSEVSKDERAHVIRRLMQTDESVAGHPLALYSKEVIERLSNDPCLLNEVFGFIEGHYDILPVLSAVPLSAMPKQFRNYAQKFTTLNSEVIHSNDVVPVRHVNNYAGTCAWMGGFIMKLLLKNIPTIRRFMVM